MSEINSGSNETKIEKEISNLSDKELAIHFLASLASKRPNLIELYGKEMAKRLLKD